MPRRLALLLPVIMLVLTGCAIVGAREDAASAVALRMLTAIAADDGATACGTLAPETLAELEQSAEKPCAQAILDEDLPPPGRVRQSRVYGQWAQVRLTGDTVFLAVFPGGWRVMAAGCTPRGERPYDCVLRGS
jgi:hypothetical protein